MPVIRESHDIAAQGIVTAAGTLEIVVESRSAATWILTQISIEMPNAPAGAKCTVRKNGDFVTLILPREGVAAGDPPVHLRPGERATITWTGVTPGDIGKVLVFYDQVRYT